MKAIKLLVADRAKFHFGDYKGGLQEYFGSDQLFSAIINNLALFADENIITSIIDLFKEGEIKISSLFYGIDICSEKDERIRSIYFLPKPQGNISSSGNEIDIREKKKNKNIRYLSLAVYRKLLASWDKVSHIFKHDLSDYKLVGNRFLCSEEEIDILSEKRLSNLKFMNYNSAPGVVVNRLNSSSDNFFYRQFLEFRYTSIADYIIKPFMYVLVDGKLNSELRTAIQLITDQGLGGLRSQGMGFFNGLEEEELTELDIFNKGDYYINLSSVYPAREELAGVINYQLRKKNGYLFSGGGQPFRKQTVRLITEGSIFSNPLKGKMIDVTPLSFKDHPVYLNGKSFLLGFKGEV